MMEIEPQPQREDDGSRAGPSAILRIILYAMAIFAGMVVAGTVGIVFLMIFSPGTVADLERALFTLPVLTATYVPTALATLLVTWLFVVFVDRRPFGTLGYNLRGSWAAETLLGLALGLGFPLLLFGVFYAAGWVRVTGTLFAGPAPASMAVVLGTIVLMTAVAVTEETIVRGYMLQTLKWRYGAAAALVVTSVIFGVLHLVNPGARFMALAGVTVAGLVLGYAYLVTGRLWLPLAIHFSWNFALGPVFGFPVSGLDLQGWIEQEVIGPRIWTGGAFGPEAGVLGIVMWLAAIPLIRWFARRAHKP